MPAAGTALQNAPGAAGRIPVRNMWLLALYASDLAQFHGRFDAAVENSPDLPDLIARLLCHAVETRLRRNLSFGFGYRRRHAVLPRVKGRIDVLATYAGDLLRQGKIACRFEDLTIDTTRNRLVRAALDALGTRVGDAALAHRCRSLAADLGFLGVAGVRPSRGDIAQDQIGRHDADDRFMVAVAKLVFDLVLPTEEKGRTALTSIQREEAAVRRLFEKAVANFLALEFRPHGWTVTPGKCLYWQTDFVTPGLSSVFPLMKTDIVLEKTDDRRRIVIDTKFTGIFTRSEYREQVLKSPYIYQMYAYLRSQAGRGDAASDAAEGVLLHPAIDARVDETVRIQGHAIRFMTIDLTLPTPLILDTLRSLVRKPPDLLG
jgi:5-methylcytosine-specific restriction enzyme subunit McrC